MGMRESHVHTQPQIFVCWVSVGCPETQHTHISKTPSCSCSLWATSQPAIHPFPLVCVGVNMSRVPAHQVMPVAGLTPAQKHRAVRTFFAHLSEKDDGGRHAGDVLGYCDTIFDYHLYNLSSTSVAERRRMRQATIKAVTQEHAVSLWVELEVGWYFESQHNPRARRLQQGRALFRRLLVPSVGFSLPLLGGSTDNPLAGIAQPITLRRPPNQSQVRISGRPREAVLLLWRVPATAARQQRPVGDRPAGGSTRYIQPRAV